MKQIVHFALAFFKTAVSKGAVHTDPQAACDYALLLDDSGHTRRARELLTLIITAPETPAHLRARALRIRCVIHMRRQTALPNALGDLAAILEMPDIEGARRAEILLLRARILERMENLPSAIESCSTVIHMGDATPEQVIAGYNTRASLRKLSGDNDGALADYAAILASPNASSHDKAWVLNSRHVLHQERGETQAAIEDLSDLIETPDVAPEAKVLSLLYRGQLFEADKLLRLAIADYTTALTYPGVPADLRREAVAMRASVFRRTGRRRRANTDEGFLFATSALWRNARVGAAAFAILAIPLLYFLDPSDRSHTGRFKEGVTQLETGEYTRALDTFNEIVEAPGADDDMRARALYQRARAHAQIGDLTAAVADYTTFLDNANITDEQRVAALLQRGRLHQKTGKHRQMLADFAAIVQRPGAPARVKSEVFLNQGYYNRERGSWKAAIADFSQAADSAAGADSATLRGTAIFARAECREKDGAHQSALADYAALANMEGIAPAQRARALLNRGDIYRRTGDDDKASADYADVLEIPSATAETRARALINRSQLQIHAGDTAKALESLTAALALHGSEGTPLADEARYQRALLYTGQSQDEEALADLDEIIETPGIPVETHRRARALRREIHARMGNSTEADDDAKEL